MLADALAGVLTTLVAITAGQPPPAAPPSQPASQPASQPTLRPPPQAEVLKQLLREQERPAGIPPQELRGGGARREEGGLRLRGATLLAEGTRLREKSGRFVQGARQEFHFDEPDLPSMEILKNSWLETMERLSEGGAAKFVISGEVSRYRGQNCLTLWKVRRQPDNGNLAP